MVDVNEVAGLLHIEEKLRAHGDKFKNMLKAVRDKLDSAEKDHTPQPEPAPEPTPEPDGPPEPTEPEQVDENGAIMERRV